MRMMVKKLLKRYKYPPEGMNDAVQTVLAQCELWTDNADLAKPEHEVINYSDYSIKNYADAAEKPASYEKR